ncbi:MAG: hypothetical protein AMS18_12385 [Gemmatimonas sp. SG8_17]|nr:MAG: hypothetical protein AMS18_12385 [Gemmatimonas sp. SG8_17]
MQPANGVTLRALMVFIPALALLSACSDGRQLVTFDLYDEPEDPAPDTLTDWSAVGPGLHASVGSIDRLYARSSIPEVKQANEWHGSAWRGEKVSAQLVLWSSEPVQQLRFEFSDFESVNGNALPARVARARFVRYVLTDEFGSACAKREPEEFSASLSPDALDHVATFDKAGNTSRPVWITIDVPRDATPGTYTATLHLHARDHDTQTFGLQLEVLTRTLPPPSEWKFHLDLWQHPYAVARMHQVELWSDAHWELMRPLMQMLADAGQKVITTTITDRPWAGQTLDPFESMIVWTKQADGGWEFDYTVFDNWVEFMMGLGIKKQINAYSLLPWTSEVTYFDEASGEKVVVEVEPGSAEYVELWTPFIIDFRTHLEEKDWSTITNLAMDESKGDKMQLMLAMMDELAPEFGIAFADDQKAYKLYPDRIKDLCVSYAAVIDEPDLEYRKSKGYPSTFYVCCRDPFPNTFTFSPPAEATFIGWYTMAAGFDGFLRWAYASWVEDPLHDSRFRQWPAGDTYLVYPDARSSIRFERLVEGIQDAEKIRILRQEFEAAGTAEARRKLELLNTTLAQFNIFQRPDDTGALVNHGKAVLEELSR